MRERRDRSNMLERDDPPEHLRDLLAQIRKRFDDEATYRAWLEDYRASGWTVPPVRRLRVTADD